MSTDTYKILKDAIKNPKTDGDKALSQWVYSKRREFGNPKYRKKAAAVQTVANGISLGAATAAVATSPTLVGGVVLGGIGLLATGAGEFAARKLNKKGMASDKVLKSNGIDLEAGEGIPKNLIEESSIDINNFDVNKFGEEISQEEIENLNKAYNSRNRNGIAKKALFGAEVVATGVSTFAGIPGIVKAGKAAIDYAAFGIGATSSLGISAIATKESLIKPDTQDEENQDIEELEIEEELKEKKQYNEKDKTSVAEKENIKPIKDKKDKNKLSQDLTKKPSNKKENYNMKKPAGTKKGATSKKKSGKHVNGLNSKRKTSLSRGNSGNSRS